MKNICVIYHSGSGHTEKLAKAVASGVKEIEGVKAETLKIKNSDIIEGRYRNEEIMAKLDKADAIIFGSPTYMGMVSGQFKCFADESSERWRNRTWQNKIAAGFTVSATPSGDKQGVLLYLATLSAQHGMIWVGNNVIGFGDEQNRNALGSYLGVMAQGGIASDDGTPKENDLATGKALGIRVAKFLLKLK